LSLGFAAALTAAFASAPAPSAADTGGEYRVQVAAVQLALPNRAERAPRTIRVGETILDVPLLWAVAATLREPARIEADGQVQELPAGTVLPMQVIGPERGERVAAFCTPRRAAERAADRGVLGVLLGGGSLWRGMIRRATDRQACLIDADGDGRAESSVILGDGSPAARRPRAVAPVAVETAELQPIGPEDRLRLKLTRVARRGGWADVELDIEQQGHRRSFDEISGPWGRSLRITRIPLVAAEPRTTSIVGAAFRIAAIDGTARTASIEWSDKPADDTAILIPDALRIVIR
jgi:hypothetical protein